MVEKSKGIPQDIDMTENRVFRHGASHVLSPFEPKANTTPWHKNGEKKRNFENSVKDENSRIRIHNIDNISFGDYTDDYDLLMSYNGNRPIEKPILTEDPKSIIPYLRDYTFEVTREGVFFTNGDTPWHSYRSSSTKSWIYTDDIMNTYTITNTDNNTSFTISDWWAPDRTKIISNTITVSNRPKDSNVTPSYFIGLTLTSDEFSGRKLITGSGTILKTKYQLRLYLLAVQDIIKEYGPKKKMNTTVCVECGRYFVKPNGKHDKCCYCSNHEYFSNSKRMAPSHKTMNFHKRKMLGECNMSFAHVDNQMSLYHHFVNSSTIDYYRHPRYEDRGRHIIAETRRRISPNLLFLPEDVTKAMIKSMINRPRSRILNDFQMNQDNTTVFTFEDNIELNTTWNDLIMLV